MIEIINKRAKKENISYEKMFNIISNFLESNGELTWLSEYTKKVVRELLRDISTDFDRKNKFTKEEIKLAFQMASYCWNFQVINYGGVKEYLEPDWIKKIIVDVSPSVLN